MPNRRTFLTTTAKATALALSARFSTVPPAKPLLSFSTLGCPRWSLDQILACASTNGYKGLELRGLQGELDLPKCPEFSTPERIKATRRIVEDKGVRIINLGTSTQLHHADATKRREQLDHAKRFIDLAAQLNCPYVRVFPNDLPANQDRQQTIDLIIGGLVDLGTFVGNGPVSILLESHGKVIESALLNQIMTSANRSNVGLIWDVVNMWSVTKEPPIEVYRVLKPHIRHVHLKDAKLTGDKLQYTLLGEGEAPLAEAIGALTKGGYSGYYSFEWEKLWHPELPDPEIAMPHFAKTVQRYF
ncbi:sugar phosphate isomerase/epimerase family protein [Spirosoma montaniterrae]|uniref:Xylose isomerase n=1 Tax=Spirosoma montaniterrae TaxID=1178516 RepID=A0A1P9WWV7_9BACT|nr:sugar phosphate isomerase/epimerase family protein [Spirosoma montaniterrae]AQG79830.1 xylose isomerase [Spirosoma montaniterrae]